MAYSSETGTFTAVTGLPGGDTLAYNANGLYIAPGFSGFATWISNSSGSWNSACNWTDGFNHAVPGVPPRPASTDTATFSGSGSQTSVDLTGVSPSLAA